MRRSWLVLRYLLAAVLVWAVPGLAFAGTWGTLGNLTVDSAANLYANLGVKQVLTPLADGVGGAFFKGTQALVADGVPVSIGISELASESALATAAAGAAPALVTAAATIAGINLALYGLNLIGNQFETAGPLYDTLTCKDGTQAYFYENGGQQMNIGQVETYFNSASTYMVNPYVVGFIGKDGGASSAQYTCDDGSAATPAAPQVAASPAQVQTDIGNALKANPNDAPAFANQLTADGVSVPTVPQVATGPTTVTGTSITTSTTTSPAPGTSTPTSQTVTCTPKLSLSYGPNQVAVGETKTCTTTTTGPSGTASSATTASTPAPASSPQSGYSLPTTPVPTVPPVSPTTIQVPQPTINTTTGTCPAPLTLNLGLPAMSSMTLNLQPWCDLAANLRPWVLTLAGIVASVIVVR